MKRTLRIRLAASWRPADALAWSLHDDGTDRTETGEDPSVNWPAHDRLEAVIAAAPVRLVALALPPMPANRLAAAARFAVEDQIAVGDAGAQIVVAPGVGGSHVAVICPRDLLQSLQPRKGALAHLRRAVAEPELCPPGPDWRWCLTERGEGFVRLPDGSAFATSRAAENGDLPAELAIALGRARSETIPAVRVDGRVAAADLARWQAATNVPFVAGEPWRWDTAARETPGTDLLQDEFVSDAAPRRPRLTRLFAPALVLLALAALVQVLGALGTWMALRADVWRADASWKSVGLAAGLPANALGSIDDIRRALDRRHRALLHGQRQFARDDALPLLARASAVMGALPPGSLKRATYADTHWTFDLQGLDTAAARRLEAGFRQADLEALVVPVDGGVRVRMGTR